MYVCTNILYEVRGKDVIYSLFKYVVFLYKGCVNNCSTYNDMYTVRDSILGNLRKNIHGIGEALVDKICKVEEVTQDDPSSK